MDYPKLLLSLPFVVLLSAPAQSPVVAFPEAQGFGATATGGRGRPVRTVTNLDDDGPGSFRDAASRSGVTVLFAVGRTVHLKSNMELGSDLTIAGQTAPGSGITITGAKVSMSHAHNIIIRFVRFRGGVAESPKASSLNLSDAAHVMLDHLSIEWGRWDNIQTNGNTYSTIQDSIIGQGIVPQRFGCLCESDFLTLARNLWIDNKSRNPKGKGHIQYVNNVVYNWGVDGYVGGHGGADHFADLLGNYFIAGPDSSDSFIGEFTKTDYTYQAANYLDSNRNGKLDGQPVTAAAFEHAGADVVAEPFAKPEVPVKALPATDLIAVVARTAGDSLCRDSVDRDLIAQLLSFGKLGRLIADETELTVEPPVPAAPAPTDSDADGIPDAWELSHHLNPHDSADAQRLDPRTGYSNLEDYLNELADATARPQTLASPPCH